MSKKNGSTSRACLLGLFASAIVAAALIGAAFEWRSFKETSETVIHRLYPPKMPANVNTPLQQPSGPIVGLDPKGPKEQPKSMQVPTSTEPPDVETIVALGIADGTANVPRIMQSAASGGSTKSQVSLNVRHDDCSGGTRTPGSGAGP